jgi:hypothetical protein
MDIATLIFVALLCFAAFLLTVTVRREFLARERQRPEDQPHPRHTRRKP